MPEITTIERPFGHSAAEQPPAPPGAVAILLCTFNGARFLPLQFASFEAQDFAGWRLFVSDDGSHDDTLDLLEQFQRKHGPSRVDIRRGPGRGVVANFLSLICDPAIESDYYALSDQDDVWDPYKLSRARSVLMDASPDVPNLYCSRFRWIDERGAETGLGPLLKKTPQFRHALVQNITTGNTMVFNERLRGVLMQAGADVNAAVHDWWIYLAATAVGGRIFYDPYPSVGYRIHERNLIGRKGSRLSRAQMLLTRFKTWNDLNIGALERIESAMPEQNRQDFDLFRRSRKQRLLPRLHGLLRSGVHRETMRDNIGLILAALLGQI